MPVASTMVPALSPTAPTRIRKPISHTQADPPEAPVREVEAAGAAVAEPEHAGKPQHMRALARANEVRLARARMKREIASGQRPVLDVVRETPWEAQSMTVSELLSAQRRWGKARSRKLIVSIGLTETKRLGSFTPRQRGVLADALEAKACG